MLFAPLLAFAQVLQTSLVPIMPLAIVALIASAGIIALMYMLGSALQSQDILALAKDNLGSLIMSGIIVLLFFALFAIVSSVVNAIACGGTCADHVAAAYQSVLMVRAKLISLYMQLYVYEIVFGFLSTLGFSIPIPAFNPATMVGLFISIPSISFSPLAGLTPLSNAHTVVVEAVGTALLMVLARQVLLEFIMNYMYPFFALGIGLRAFSFTKRTGSSMLALAAVAYFVYPLAVLFTNYVIFDQYRPAEFNVVPTAIGYCEDPAGLTAVAEEFGGTEGAREALYTASIPKDTTPWYAFWDFLESAADFLFESVKMIAYTFYTFNAKLLFGMILSPVLFSAFYDFLIMEIQTQVQFLVLVFVAFMLEIVITITMYRALASFMEGETEIFGISKLM